MGRLSAQQPYSLRANDIHMLLTLICGTCFGSMSNGVQQVQISLSMMTMEWSPRFTLVVQ